MGFRARVQLDLFIQMLNVSLVHRLTVNGAILMAVSNASPDFSSQKDNVRHAQPIVSNAQTLYSV